MGRKLGRNEPCWCGSGKKYKKCHLDRSDQKPLALWEIDSKVRNAYSTKLCMAPEEWHQECEQEIVSAHTVPRSSLKEIARNGEVYTFLRTHESAKNSNGTYDPKLTGIRKASTFRGFCRKHDDSIFISAEKFSFEATLEQCFVLAYRALALAFYNKLCSSRLIPLLKELDRGRSLAEQFVHQEKINLFAGGIKAALRLGQQKKDLYDQALVNRDFSGIEAYVIEFDQPPPVMGSSMFQPEQNFTGNQLQSRDLTEATQLISVTSFWGRERGGVLFAWLTQDSPACRALTSSLDQIPDDTITDALVSLIFEHCENIYLNPDWWESLPREQQTALVQKFTASISPDFERPPNYLVNYTLGLRPWAVRSRKWINVDI